MNNLDFDMLAKLAVNEANFGDYMQVVKKAGKSALKNVAKGAVRLAAQAPGAVLQGAGKAIQGAGAAYGALGGKQGAALANSVGSTVARAGKTVRQAGLGAVTNTAAAARNFKTAADRQQNERENMKGLRAYIKNKFPTVGQAELSKLDNINNYDELEKFTKKNIRGRNFDQILYGYNNYQAAEQAKKTVTTGTPAPATATPSPATVPAATPSPATVPAPAATSTLTGPNAANPDGTPVRGQSRYITSDKKRNYLYGKTGWMILDPATKKWNPVKQQSQITTAWQSSRKVKTP